MRGHCTTASGPRHDNLSKLNFAYNNYSNLIINIMMLDLSKLHQGPLRPSIKAAKVAFPRHTFQLETTSETQAKQLLAPPSNQTTSNHVVRWTLHPQLCPRCQERAWDHPLGEPGFRRLPRRWCLERAHLVLHPWCLDQPQHPELGAQRQQDRQGQQPVRRGCDSFARARVCVNVWSPQQLDFTSLFTPLPSGLP